MAWSLARRYFRVAIPLALVVFVVALLTDTKAGHIVAVLAVLVLFVPALCWIALYAYRFGAWAFDEAVVAATPIPDPFQIAQALQNEWGRPPTAQEVQVVQEVLVHRRNQAAGAAVLSLGALYLISR